MEYIFDGDDAIKQGATWRFHATVIDKTTDLPLNLTGYTARMQIRGYLEATSVLVTLTTENGKIALGGALGTIDGELSATETTEYTWKTGVFDLELVNGTIITRILSGKIQCVPEVTR